MSEERSTSLHPREGPGRRYVYVVRSRRAGGLSVGINLDPQKTCNFDCVYCEVIDRRDVARGRGRPRIDAGEVVAELEDQLRRSRAAGEDLRDIAFAGDGEPSTFPGFLELARRVLDARDAAAFGGGAPPPAPPGARGVGSSVAAAGLEIPLVLITNGSGLDRQEMLDAHDLFAARGGVFWIKLDAGTEAFYTRVCRTAVPFERVLRNLREAARRHPIVIQSMLFRQGGEAPPELEIDALAGRVAGVVGAGGSVRLVQVYTVARETTEPGIEPLTEGELERIAEAVRRRAPGVPVATFA